LRFARRRTLVVIGLAALLQAGATLQPVQHAVADPTEAPTTPWVEGTTPAHSPATPDRHSTGTEAATPEASTAPAPTNASEPGDTAAARATPGEAAPEAVAEPTAVSPPAGRSFVRPHVVVYGGTPAGVSAAIAAAEGGARVVLVSESSTVGGLMSNGISASDIGSGLAVQGLAKRFFERIRSYYGDSSTWRFEPRIAERVLRAMLRDAGVRVQYRSPVASVTLNDRRIRCGRFGLLSACGHSFIDASYTGDLMAAAGVPHRLGMGDYYAYGPESLPAERGWFSLLSVAPEAAAAARAAFEANPFVTVAQTLDPYPDAYHRGTPSITYRLCVTRSGDRIPFLPATGYDALVPSFRLFAARMRDEVVHKSNGTLLSDAFHLAALPGGKYDLNAGRFSFTNLPTPVGYFDLGADRVTANRQIRDYVESFFHFVGTDPSVPPSVQEAFAPFGLCADEFTDNGGWPREPYVREGRRLEGRYTVTDADIFTQRQKATAVALASYNIDTKLTQFVYAQDSLHRDMGAHATVPVYELPFEAMLPEASVVNLLVPVGLSASPTAFGSIRMEPQWMALGEAAGIAAALAVRKDRTVDSVPVTSVQWVLRARGVLHKAEDICLRTPQIFRAAGGYTFYCDVLPVVPKAAPTD
jgi:hypothetical protein